MIVEISLTNKVKSFQIKVSNQREYEQIKQSLQRNKFYTFIDSQLTEGFEKTVNVDSIELMTVLTKDIIAENISQEGSQNAVSKILSKEDITAANRLSNPNVEVFEKAAIAHNKLIEKQKVK